MATENTVTLESVADLAPGLEPLKVADRCDHTACPSQAWVRFLKHNVPLERIKATGRGVLDFCKHHAEGLEATLTGEGWLISEDNRSKINEKPSACTTASD